MRKWTPLLAICLGTFMLLVDVTIVNVALPSMALDLKSSFSSLQWVVDAYALVLAALLMGIGSTADIVGHRRAYLFGLGVFAASSLVCGLSSNVGTLVAARAVQGLGGAAMFATTFALLNASYTGRDRGAAYGIWGAVSGASAAIGPIAGGLLTEAINWRWIFFVNLPVSVAAVALSLKYLPGERPNIGRRVDVPGVVVFTAAAAALTFAMIRAGRDGWGSGTVLLLLAVGVVALVAFVLVERAVRHPLIDLALFRNRTFIGVVIAALVFNFTAFAVLTYTSIWQQSLLGLSPIQAGLTGLPFTVGSFLVSGVLGSRLHRVPAGRVIGIGMAMIGLADIVSAGLIGSGSSWTVLIAGFVIAGLGTGMAIPILSSTAMSAVPPQRGGMAAGAVNTARQLGYAFGIALLGSIFTSRASSSLDTHGVADHASTATAIAGGQAGHIVSAAGPAAAHVSGVLHSAFASGLRADFLVAGGAGIVAGLAALLLIKPKPAEAPAWQQAKAPTEAAEHAAGAPAESEPLPAA